MFNATLTETKVTSDYQAASLFGVHLAALRFMERDSEQKQKHHTVHVEQILRKIPIIFSRLIERDIYLWLRHLTSHYNGHRKQCKVEDNRCCHTCYMMNIPQEYQTLIMD